MVEQRWPENKTVVITGASRGLGHGCAKAFAAGGAKIVLVARQPAELEQLSDEIRGSGGSARAVSIDLTREVEVQQLFASLESCDVLINNAGMNRPQPFLDVDLGTLDDMLRLNVRSMFVTAQAAARVMARKGSGAIVNMSSQMGHVGAPKRAVYCMTKHAIEGLTKAMALELAPLGIRVNAVAPTYVETPMTRPMLAEAAFRQDVLARIPMGRVGQVEEVAAAVLFLASPAASLITGTSLRVDGGYTAQ